MTLDGLLAEIYCWREKLKTMHARQLGSPTDLAIRKLQTREINERIADLTKMIAVLEAIPKKRPRRKRMRRDS
jgi:uncharacterized small protein (DUF1192 family)